ncbi:MAG: YCF48-related protein [Candidatus Thiodiazotropha sp.]
MGNIWLAIFIAIVAFPVEAASVDPLVRPSMISPYAANAVLLGIDCSGEQVISVGEKGTILVSSDAGGSWKQVGAPVSVSLTNVRFASDKSVWTVGHSGVVLHSDDAGESWSKKFDGVQAAQVYLAAVNSKPVEETYERLKFEAERLVADGPDKPFFDVYFFDEKQGFLIGAYGLFFGTNDGGNTWQSWHDRIDNPRGMHLYSIEVSGQDIYIAGEQGVLFHSNDMGGRFKRIETPYEGTLFDVIAGNNETLVIVGLRGNAFYSNDGGMAWNKSKADTEYSLTAGTQLANGDLVVVDNGGQLLLSKNNAVSFEPIVLERSYPFTDMMQLDDGGLVVSGARGVINVPSSSVNQAL